MREVEWIEIKRRCLNRVSDDVFEDFRPIAVWESDGGSLGISVCVPAVSSFVPVVPVSSLGCECDR